MTEYVWERRRHPRAGVSTSTTAYLDDVERTRYVVENLSAGGALLSGGPHLPVGAELSLILHIREGRTISVRARVVRHGDSTTLGVEFIGLGAADEDLIHAEVRRILMADVRTRSHRNRARRHEHRRQA